MNKLVTETECYLCEEATYEQRDGDTFCPNCYVVLGSGGGEQAPTAWESFWRHRAENYSGHHGPERKKCVGGFAKVYHEDDSYV